MIRSLTGVRMNLALALVTVLLVSQVCASPSWNVAKSPELSADIDALHSRYDAAHMPGAIIAVLRHGEVLHLKGYGFANREFDIPWTPDTLYTFFSTTKSMTCLALVTLARQGKVALDDPIQKYLGDFPRFGQAVTIRHLMNHTSGLWQDESVMHLAGVGASYSPMTLQELYELNKRQRELPYAPGSNYYYNDAGTRIAARIIEQVTGMDFGAAMRNLVFAPAGMTTARIKSYEPKFYPNQASSYLLDGSPPANAATDAIAIGGIIVETSGDGAAVGSMGDFIAYARYLSTPRADGSKWIDDLTPQQTTTTWYDSPYKYGLSDQLHRGLRVIHHGGLYGKRIAYLPSLDLWVLMMRNALDYQVASDFTRMTDIIDAALRHLDGGVHLSVRNPDRDSVIGIPREQRWSAGEIAQVSGTFIEPLSGFVVRVGPQQTTGVTQLRYSFHGTEGTLARDRNRIGYVTYGATRNAIHLVPSADGPKLQYADWPLPRALRRIPPERQFSPDEIRALAGWYRSEELGVIYELVPTPEGLELRIGGGNRHAENFSLRSVTPEVFEAEPKALATFLDLGLTIKVEREAGEVSGFVINSADVKNLRLRRLQLLHPPPSRAAAW